MITLHPGVVVTKVSVPPFLLSLVQVLGVLLSESLAASSHAALSPGVASPDAGLSSFCSASESLSTVVLRSTYAPCDVSATNHRLGGFPIVWSKASMGT